MRSSSDSVSKHDERDWPLNRDGCRWIQSPSTLSHLRFRHDDLVPLTEYRRESKRCLNLSVLTLDLVGDSVAEMGTSHHSFR